MPKIDSRTQTVANSMTMTEGDSIASRASIFRVTDAAVATRIEPLLREYGEWAATQIERSAGIRFTHSELEQHHDAFRREFPLLLGARGRLLCAQVDQRLVGVGALKPMGDATAEIKRMYVRPFVQGMGVERMILDRLVLDARSEGYKTIQLETLRFMVTAQAMYRSAGFHETHEFVGSRAGATPLAPLALLMVLDLATEAETPAGPSGED
jgi:ribosomal protein S18 acetylase RimI-like enzyme